MDENDSHEKNRAQSSNEPYPGPLAAIGLALSALFISSFIASLLASTGLMGQSALMASMGIGYTIGVGGLATLAAQRVPAPQDLRIGLKGFDRWLIAPMLALLPTVFLLSESNIYLEALMPPSSEFLALRAEMKQLLEAQSTLAKLQTAVVALGIIPITEGFLFFGIILQGLNAQIGVVRGVLLTTFLYSVVHFPASGAPGDSLVPLPTWLVIGALLCLVRMASGSILPVICLSAGFSLIHLIAAGQEPWFTIQSFNIPGEGIPAMVFWPSLISVGWGLMTLWKTLQSKPDDIPTVVLDPHEETKDDL